MFWLGYDCSLVCFVGLLELIVFLGFALFCLFGWVCACVVSLVWVGCFLWWLVFYGALGLWKCVLSVILLL